MNLSEPVASSTRTLRRIQTLIPTLIPSEQRVAHEVIDHPDEVSVMSGADLAERTGTSAATVSRTFRHLGFDGFQELKTLLIREVILKNYTSADPSDERSTALNRYAHTMSESVRDLFLGVDEAALQRCAETIASARRILVTATSGSTGIAQLVQFRFFTAGVVCEAPVDSFMQDLHAQTLTADDVCIVISQSGSNPLTLKTAETASHSGATVIGITSYPNSPVTRISDHVLSTPASLTPEDPGSITMNTMNILLISYLQLEVLKWKRRLGHL